VRLKCFCVALLLLSGGPLYADSFSFTASDIIAIMAGQGAPLYNATDQWGLWAIRAMPIVTGGTYTFTGASTDQTGWGVAAPNGIFGSAPYTAANSVWFYDESGSEVAGNPANPLYMIMNQPASTFTSSTFNGSGVWVGDVPPGSIQPPGYDGGAGGTNVITAAAPTSFFDVFFELAPGAVWNGQWQFVVDGSRYNLGTEAQPGTWKEDFFGGYDIGYGDVGGALANNSGPGYQARVPEASSVILLIAMLAGLAAVSRITRGA